MRNPIKISLSVCHHFLFILISALIYPTLTIAQVIGPSIEILSPAPNTCVPNQTPNQLGLQPGQAPNFSLSPVTLSLRLNEINGATISLSATINGNPVNLNRSDFTPSFANIPEETTAIQMPADQITDGAKTLVITATSANGQASAQVSFDLDRLPPSIVYAPEDVGYVGQCSNVSESNFNLINPTVQDAFDPNPTIEITNFQNGCVLSKNITVRDHCGIGNSQSVVIQSRKPALSPPDIDFTGVQNGFAGLSALVSFDAIAPSGCVDVLQATLSKDQGIPLIVNNGSTIEEEGNYVLNVTAQNCNQIPIQESISFTILAQPRAEAGGPYQTNEGQAVQLSAINSFCPPELGPIIEYAWDFDAEDPTNGYDTFGRDVSFTPLASRNYIVGLRITTLSGEIRYDFASVTVGDLSPTCRLGGPYRAYQGELLELDASQSTDGSPDEPILAYEWFFGDGNSLYIVNNKARHRFNQDGTFIVTMTAHDIDSSCTATTTVTISDVMPVVSGLALFDPLAPVIEGNPIVFSSGTTTAGSSAEPILSFSWHFGDQSPPQTSQGNVELRSPSHTYQDQGNYQVCLTVDDGDSPASGCLPIIVTDLIPIARINGSDFGIEGQPVSFTALGSRAGGNADPLRKYVWDFGDGSARVEIFDLNQIEIEHAFQTNGNLIVTLEVHDEDSVTKVEWPIYIDDVSPFASFSQVGPLPAEGIATRWSAARSEPGAPTDLITLYRWSFGDGTVLEGADLVEVEHVWADDDIYEISLTVFDEDGSASTQTRFINVVNLAPQNARIITTADAYDLGESIRFEVAFDDVPADPVSIRWRMGEGTTFSNRNVVNHTYREINIFTVRVELQDDDGGITQIQKDIQINPAGPKILLPNLPQVYEGDLLTFDLRIVSSENGRGQIDGPVSYRVSRHPEQMTWIEIPTPNPTNEKILRFQWQTSAKDAGQYALKIKATSLAGLEREATLNIEVRDAIRNMLATLGGSVHQSNLTFYQYETLDQSYGDDFRAIAMDEIGMGFGKFLFKSSTTTERNLPKHQAWVTSPQDGSVHVFDVSANIPKKIRKIPLSGHPFAIVESKSFGDTGLVWVFDVWSNQVHILDQKLKIYRKSNLPFTKGVYDALALSYEEDQITKTFFLVAQMEGNLRVINAEAVLNNQGDRSLMAETTLAKFKPAQLFLKADRNEVWVLQDRLLQAYDLSMIQSLVAQGEDPFRLKWQVKLNFAPQKLEIVQETDGTEMIWAISPQGLRKYPMPMDQAGLVDQIPFLVPDLVNTESYRDFQYLDPLVLGKQAVVMATERNVGNYDLRLQTISDYQGLNIQKLLGISFSLR
jgi:PKD repeat protein